MVEVNGNNRTEIDETKREESGWRKAEGREVTEERVDGGKGERRRKKESAEEKGRGAMMEGKRIVRS